MADDDVTNVVAFVVVVKVVAFVVVVKVVSIVVVVKFVVSTIMSCISHEMIKRMM